MGGSVEEDDGEDVQVPHAEHPREKSTVDLESVVSAVPVAFTDLVKNKKSWDILSEPKHDDHKTSSQDSHVDQ